MRILQLISRLLDYPDEYLVENLAEMSLWLQQDEIDREVRENLQQFIAHFSNRDLLDWQSEYEGLFERGRSVSLHLFEHVHGESRDRGQAMVDLLRHYREAGLALAEKELPDYLPTYLEFCSTQGDSACYWLDQTAHVLALLGARLKQKKSSYACLLTALLSLLQLQVDMDALVAQVAQEERDDTPQALDKIWEEEMVSFSAGDACRKTTQRSAAERFAGGDEAITWAEPGSGGNPVQTHA